MNPNSKIRIKQIRDDIGTGVIEYRVIDPNNDGEIRWDGDVVGIPALTLDPESVSYPDMLAACQAHAVSIGHWVP